MQLKNNHFKKPKNTLKDNFLPPDGGWGWFCLLALVQSFGLLFRDRLKQLGISSSETTIILNVNLAMIALIGLANGPIFRKYTFRKVSIIGALVTSISIAILSTLTSFTGILIFFGILYAGGLGITMSANALALNTYFKVKRKIAVGFTWTCTGLGPIIMPQLITALMPIFGVPGTLLILSGICMNAVACALLLQPVMWHAKKATKEPEEKELLDDKLKNKIPERRISKFGSRFLYYDDEVERIDVVDPGTPMMSRSNDGWFSKKHTSVTSFENDSNKDKFVEQPIPLIVVTEIILGTNIEKEVEPIFEMDPSEKKSCLKKFLDSVVVFFDFDLLRDHVFLNIIMGISLANFVEMNFAMLTPFILAEYGLQKPQVATVMSVLGGIDVLARFFVPFVTDIIKLSNRTFFLIGVACMAAGRIILAHITSYEVILSIGVLIGFGKALRTIFMALVIPEHVPLERLPAASGLQLIISGLLSIILGPIIGLLKDILGNYSSLLHIINIISYLTIFT
ncbi:Similar to SLC16A1: Monocarboxylate transporter 1 (Bos taurus), partial [Cotesia congregata]